MVTACYRGLRIVLHLLVGVLLAAVVALDRRHWFVAQKLGQWWSAVLLDIFNLHWQVQGAPAAGARLSVANHVSWLDIPLLAACEPTRFVSKSEVRRWPVAGWLAEAMGTFYIHRGKGGSKPLLQDLTPHLAAGGNVVIFPEGTTTDGHGVLDFHSRLFSAAIEANCLVQPIAIRYGNAVAPFIGDDDLVSHILRVLREPELTAWVSYCAPLPAAGRGRDELAQAARSAICQSLAAPAAALDSEPLGLLAA